MRNEIVERIALPATVGGVIVHRRDPIAREGYTITRWALETEPGVLIPTLLFRAEPAADRPMVVYVGADRALAAPGGPIEARVKAGEHVALVEPRGMGEGSPGTGKDGPFGPDLREAFLSLHLNRPLLGQRVFDVLQALRGLDGEAKNPIHLFGVGAGGPIVLHAAILADRVDSVGVERSVPSWSLVARTRSPRGDLASVVPGVLKSYDLPDLATMLAPRPLTFREPVDPAGHPLAQAAIDEAYVACKSAYATAGAAEKIILRGR